MRMEIERSLPAGPWGTELVTRPQYAPTTPMAAAPEAPPPNDWKRYLRIVSRHKKLVALVTIVGTVLGFVGAHFLPQDYAVKSILWVERQKQDRPDDGHDVVYSEVSNTTIDAAAWSQVVTSNAVLDSVVYQMRLFVVPKHPEDQAALASLQIENNLVPGDYRVVVSSDGKTFEFDQKDGTVLQRGNVGDSIGGAQGIAWKPGPGALPAGKKLEFSVMAPYEASLALAKDLKVRIDEGSPFLVIQLKGKDPVRTAGIVNAVSQRTVVVGAEMKQRRFQDLASILSDQFDHAKQNLDTAEARLRDYRIRTAGALGARTFAFQSTQPGTNVQEPYELQAQMQDLQRQRDVLDQVAHARPGTPLRVEALAALPSVHNSPELNEAITTLTQKQSQLRDLRTRYTDEAAPVLQLQGEIDSLQSTAIPALAGSLSEALASQQSTYRPQINQTVGALRRIPTLELDDERLARDVQGAEELATNVRQRYEAARLALVSSTPDVRILDNAVVPHKPAVSLGPILIALAFLTSLGLAVAVVVIREGTDTKVRYPEQVTRGMNLQILGAIPHVGSRTFSGDAAAPIVEALRALRLRVLHGTGGAGPTMLTITSPAMGEGKSFISSNLALSFADAGYRTLLVDGDLRRGALNVIMGTDARPGLTDVLAGTASMKDVVKDTSHAGLAFVSAGTRMHRAPELLLSQRLREAFEDVKTSYDVIIVDSPPLAAGVDPVVLGTITRNLMLVLRSGRSELSLASAKLEAMNALPLRIIGAVLNDVRDGGAFRHYTYEDYVAAIGGTATTGRDGPRILQGASSDD